MSYHVSWFAGIDLGDHKHHVHLTDAAGTFGGAAAFSHEGKGVAAERTIGGSERYLGDAMEPR